MSSITVDKHGKRHVDVFFTCGATITGCTMDVIGWRLEPYSLSGEVDEDTKFFGVYLLRYERTDNNGYGYCLGMSDRAGTEEELLSDPVIQIVKMKLDQTKIQNIIDAVDKGASQEEINALITDDDPNSYLNTVGLT